MHNHVRVISMIVTVAAAVTLQLSCAGDQDDHAVDTIVQKVPKCSVTRVFFDVPILAPAPGEACVVWPPGGEFKRQCPPEWKIRPVDVICANSCNRGAILCTWVDFYGVERVFEGRVNREPDVESWIACNNRNSCDGNLPPPGTL